MKNTTLLESLIRSFQRKEAVRCQPIREASLREGGLGESEELELLRKIAEQERARQGISDPTDG